MLQVTVSSKFQVVIPKEVRLQLPIRAGQKLAVVVKAGTITLLPDRPLTSLRGFATPLSLEAIREKQDRT